MTGGGKKKENLERITHKSSISAETVPPAGHAVPVLQCLRRALCTDFRDIISSVSVF